MDRPLRQHITELERRVQKLGHEIMENQNTRIERNRMESELRVAQQALEHFQQALKLERAAAALAVLFREDCEHLPNANHSKRRP